MLYITQLIYLVEGQEQVFDEFESLAIPIVSKYRGRLLFRIRPTENSFIESQEEKPYEIHLVEFETAEDFQRFMKDKERKNFLHLKERSIRSSVIIQGTVLT